MSAITLQLQDATRTETIAGVHSFQGRDASGSFTLWPGHIRMMTVLEFGLARFRTDSAWEYLALPGAVLYFVRDTLYLSTRRYVHDPDPERIADVLERRLREEEVQLMEIRESLRKMEEGMFKRLWQLGRRRA
ncbi:F-type H+-transporting ATPase subunit epsilon [Methylomarinovum tepidoasis]|uniref:F-type H+-transporting ATPase subunit epsilon n=1 Tax=Methylomarinovum tepidoasis TaxID=2840183 RepID=A0AAU9CAR3_9GAMM|nr:F0F1 ATP synthase subunit epsilon [Methylomarinovum sp. IN45]BCX89580.1 F-type H+-transporting ATPase subunit epsilon [Methylomarinovum sp. IN45]